MAVTTERFNNCRPERTVKSAANTLSVRLYDVWGNEKFGDAVSLARPIIRLAEVTISHGIAVVDSET